jgi:hypothetical protein
MMGFMQENSHCNGMVDRYRILGPLPALPLTDTVTLRRFAAVDEVSAQDVILETLPANFGRDKQLALRKFLSRNLEQVNRSQTGLPAFMHEIWELDEAAVTSCRLRVGETLLVYNISDRTMFAQRSHTPGDPENALLLAAICGLLLPSHQKNLGHGFLCPETIWGSRPDAVQLTDFAVAAFLAQLEQGSHEEDIHAATPEQDLQAVKKLCRQWLDSQADTADLQNAPDLQALQANLLTPRKPGNPPSEPVASSTPPQPEAVTPAPSAQPEAEAESPAPAPAGRRSALALLLLPAVVLLIILAALLGALWGKRQSVSSPEATAAAEAAPPPEIALLTVQRTMTRLEPTFATSFTLETPLPDCGPLQLTFLGQNTRVDLLWTESGLNLNTQTGKKEHQFLPWSSPPQPGQRFTVVKTTTTIAAYCNGVFLAGTVVSPQQWRQLKWLAPGDRKSIPKLSYQKIGTLLFNDDFMHSDGALGEWKALSGTWSVHSLQTPVRSANPFSFIGKGDAAEAAVGYWFWRNYRLQCAIQPLNAPRLGLKFCCFDDKTYYTLQWEKASGAEDSPAQLSLLRTADGEEKMLASIPLPQTLRSWYDFSISQQEGLLEVCIGGNILLQAIDPQPLLGGGIALLSSGSEGAVFDDVKVSPCDSLRLLCPGGLPAAPPLLWQYEKSTPPAIPDAEALTCHSLWLPQPELVNAELRVEFAALPQNHERYELSLRHNGIQEILFQFAKAQDSAAYQAAIILRQLGRDTVLASADCQIPVAGDGLYRLTLQVRGSDAWGSCNGQTLCYAAGLPSLAAGQAAVRQFTLDGDRLPGWRAISCALQPPLAPPLERIAMFTHEESMRLWNDPVLEWERSGELFWYRGDFWQDVNASLDLRQVQKFSTATSWGILFGTQAKDSSANVAIARLTYQPASKTLQLQIEDSIVASLNCPESPADLTLQRCGTLLLVKQDGKLLWNHPLPERLHGLCLVGRIGYGNTPAWANALTILANGITSYSFQEAPAAWTTASGTWEITNRWQCDPRWSFFSGVNLEGPACLWNKFQHGDRVSFDFFVGPKMDSERGKKYEYAGDFSLVLGADGRDISSGYSFMFAGWDNRGSQIVRQKKIMVENPAVTIPRSSAIHRQWFHLKIRKNHDRLTFWADGKLVGTCQDSEPLPGRRFGLWTWKNGFMIAQFRVSSDDYSPAPESVTEVPVLPKTPYN